MGKILRFFVYAVVLVALLALLTLFGYRQLCAPKIDGNLQVQGLKQPVDVVRDHEGIPHIFASSKDDAWFALGYVHAQDRLWQMMFNRRIASGKLAEILGPSALPTDRYLRTLGVHANAEQQWLAQDGEAKLALQRYADGVNAYLKERKGPLPLEFILTSAPAPEPWTPADSLAWVTMMAWDLSGNGSTELLRMRLAEHLSKKQIDEFLPPYPGNSGVADEPLPSADYTELYKRLKGLGKAMAMANRYAPEPLTEGKGSNNWVIAGSRSQTGKPLLANDPHLGLSAPSLWYLAAITAPGINVIGATLPGLPGVVLGHNDHIAWGETNTGPDTQDFYIEELDGDKARTPTGWQPLQTRDEVIHVKGGADETLHVRISRHGPLMSDVAGSAATGLQSLDKQHYALAFQWVALRADDHTFGAVLGVNSANNWADFVTALSGYSSPEQNIVYADIEGNIGYFAPGRIPVRSPQNDLHGQAPAPGWQAKYDWTGWIALDQLPQRFNPPEGMVVTANQKIVDDGYQPFLTAEWAPPFRAQRIEQMLAAKPLQSMQSFVEIQSDQTSLAEKELMPLLLQTAASNPSAADALKRLSAWDGKMSPDSVEPTIYHAWLRELARLIEEDKLGTPLFKETWSERPVFLLNVLRNQNGAGHWCDDTRTPAVETCDQIKTQALDLALGDLTQRLGSDPRKWAWGKVHPAVSAHAPFDHVSWLAPLFDLSVPVGGDNETVDVGQFRIGAEVTPNVVFHAPSLRAIYDLSDLDHSVFIQSTGQSGARLSPLYANMMQRWADVEYVPMQLARGAAEKNALGILKMSPPAQ